jgi:hypothetical protein
VGTGYDGRAMIERTKHLWFATNDNNPYNGGADKKFEVNFRIVRKTKEDLGFSGIGPTP